MTTNLVAVGGTGSAPGATAAEVTLLGTCWPFMPGQELRDALRPGIGFSFIYDGHKVGPELTSDWQAETADKGLTAIFRHPSGLTVIRQARLFPEAGTIEYTVVFRNDSQAPLPALKEIKAIDVSFSRPAGGADVITSCGGAGVDKNFPPGPTTDFSLTRTSLSGTTRALSFSADRGRCSRLTLPFFYVQNVAQDAGLFAALGWSGQWEAVFESDPARNDLHIAGGIADLNICLPPKEQISGPVILLGVWRGPGDVGVNTLRRLIRDQYRPKLNGQRIGAPILYTTWFQIGLELDEQMVGELIDRAAEMGQEIFEVDAGWYNGTPSALWNRMDVTWKALSESLGNWEEGADPKRFPSGLKALAERVRAKGMKFGLWFEPERVGMNSRLAREVPEGMIANPADPKHPYLLADLGQPKVQDYFCRLFDRLIDELDMAYIRWDMNTHDLVPLWKIKDGPDRQGITQIRYIEGLHKIEEHILRKHPQVIFENCAGGGTRIDLTELAHRHTIWVSDSTRTSFAIYHLQGMHQFIPGGGQMVGLELLPNETRQPNFTLPDYHCQVCFGGAFGTAGRMQDWSAATRQTVRRNVEVFKQLRRFLDQDYYPLLPQPRTEQSWAGWQFHDPQTQEGFVQAFRVHAPEVSKSFPLKGMDAAKTYRFTDPYTQENFEMNGSKLQSAGLEFKLPELSSRVLLYQPVSH